MALSGYAISGDVYAWAAVFILPVNSALNPILYTLTAIVGKKSFTPNANEQVRNTIHKGKAKRFLENQKLTELRFNLNDHVSPASYMTIHEYLQEIEVLPTWAILRIMYQLTECLVVLHKNALVLEQIDEHSIYVKANHTKITGDVQIRREPTVCSKLVDQQKDIFKLGLLVQTLIIKNKRLK